MILRQTIAIPAAAALALAALAGCGSSGSNSASSLGSSAASAATSASASASASGSAAATGSAAGSNVGLSDSALRAAFTDATKGASALHATGTLAQQGQSIYLDLVLNKDDSSQGTIALGAAKLPVKVVGGVDYIQLTSSFLQLIAQQQHISAAQVAPVANKWLTSSSPQGKAITSGLDQFMTFSALTGNITTDKSDPATAAGTTKLNGQTVAYYTTKKGSKLYFQANGPAYLLREDDSGSDGTGTVTMLWNQPQTVTAPPASQIANLPTS